MSAKSAKTREMNRAAAVAQSQQQNANKNNNADGNNSASTTSTTDGGQDATSGSPATSGVLPRTRGGAKRKTDFQNATGAKRTKGYVRSGF